ncbi:hypothetical protein BDP27DRAFT_1309344 [Rhodocollybia butyracea]|uniref:Uncharacterized protein n=1 Tax=Rhodocollybia butyracea TaxID=206335 RepID=A0A9P5Q9Z3_9AGAR|nr:hypothetical protein BDP27DRAFT_1309344 [Rhodocollybia butyracea]
MIIATHRLTSHERLNSPSSFPSGYTITSSGINSQGNHYCTRDYGNGYNAYCYFNHNGSYYYNNPDGSTYYNSGTGYSRYTSPSGQSYVQIGR